MLETLCQSEASWRFPWQRALQALRNLIEMAEQVRVVFVYIRGALVLGKLSVKSFLGSQFRTELRLVLVKAIGRVVTVLNLVDGVSLLLPVPEINKL